MMEFNSKILLFGEYVILHGSKALAWPYKQFSGQLLVPDCFPKDKESVISNNNLHKWYRFIESNNLFTKSNTNELKRDIKKGLYFKSNIPQGYGLGSSGALSAAIYQRYFKNEANGLDFNLLKINLAKLESFFHGNSSGFDPLVSYLNKPVLLHNSTINFPCFIDGNISVFLIDSQLPRNTHRLMEYFNKIMQDKPELLEEMVQLNNNAIDSYLSNSNDFWNEIVNLVDFQKRHLPTLYTPVNEIQKVEHAFKSKLSIKICGAGGGGFFLGFCQSTYSAEIQRAFTNLKVHTYLVS